MTFQGSNIAYFFCFMITGAVLGSAIGTLIVKLFPALAVITDNLTGPIGFNLEIVSFSLKLNLSAIAGLVIGIVIFRKV